CVHSRRGRLMALDTVKITNYHWCPHTFPVTSSQGGLSLAVTYYLHTHRHTHRHRHRHRHRHTSRQTDTHTQTDRHTHPNTPIQMPKHQTLVTHCTHTHTCDTLHT